jgi:hypothetical protein
LSLLTLQRCDSFKGYKMDDLRKVMDDFPKGRKKKKEAREKKNIIL